MDLSSIHIERWGSSGPRVVLVHGGAQGTETGGERNFAFQRPLAEQGWQLIVPDRPGHGRSPDPGRPDDAEADGAWVAELLGDGAHLLGHSYGGVIALCAAGLRPEAELCRLDWSAIDLDERLIDITASKNSASHRFVKVSDNLVAWLRPLALDSGAVSTRGGILTRK